MLKDKFVVLWLSTPGYTWKHFEDMKAKVLKLKADGVWEFFIGYVPDYWYNDMGFEISPNWRQSFKFQTIQKKFLTELVKFIKENWMTALMTFNANSYNEVVYSKMEMLLEDMQEIGFDWLIISSLTMLEMLKEKEYKGMVNVSTIMSIYNKYQIEYLLSEYPFINRLVLPRELTVKEIEDLAREFPQVKFEVFISGDKCWYSNGLCFTEHNTKNGQSHSFCQFTKEILSTKKKFTSNFANIITDATIWAGDKYKLLDNSKDLTIGSLIKQYESDYMITKNDSKIVSLFKMYKDRALLSYDPTIDINTKYNQTVVRFLALMKLVEGTHPEIAEYIAKKELEVSEWFAYFKEKIAAEGLDYVKEMDLLEWDRCGLCSLERIVAIPNVEALKVPGRSKDYSNIMVALEKMMNKKDWESFKEIWCNSERYCYYDVASDKV